MRIWSQSNGSVMLGADVDSIEAPTVRGTPSKANVRNPGANDRDGRTAPPDAAIDGKRMPLPFERGTRTAWSRRDAAHYALRSMHPLNSGLLNSSVVTGKLTSVPYGTFVLKKVP